MGGGHALIFQGVRHIGITIFLDFFAWRDLKTELALSAHFSTRTNPLSPDRRPLIRPFFPFSDNTPRPSGRFPFHPDRFALVNGALDHLFPFFGRESPLTHLSPSPVGGGTKWLCDEDIDVPPAPQLPTNLEQTD
jgi:hypothetical protein